MQIPQKLFQFDELKTLIIISGSHEVRYVSAFDGEAMELGDYRVEKIKYSDKEGYFLRRAFGRVLGSGSVYEPKNKQEIVEFLSEFENKTAKAISSISPKNIILMTPDYMENKIKEKLSKAEKENILMTIHGNYVNKKLPAILKIVSKKMEKKKPPVMTSPEAQKILDKGNT